MTAINEGDKFWLDELAKQARLPLEKVEEPDCYFYRYRDDEEVLVLGYENVRGPGYMVEYRIFQKNINWKRRSFTINFLNEELLKNLGLHKDWGTMARNMDALPESTR